MKRRPVVLLSGLLYVAATLLHAQQIPPSPAPGPVPTASPAENHQRTGKAEATTNIDSVQVKTNAPAPLPPAVPAGRRVVGLALEGGGALGLAHIGVLQWMEDNHIPVDRLAGTSMGALVGSLYASGKSPGDITSLAEGVGFDKIFTVAAPYSDLDFRRREDRLAFPEAKVIGLKGDPSFRNALISDGGLNSFLVTNLFRYDSATTNFDQLPIPFRCVSTDLNTMEPVVFRAGPLPQAVRASIAIPGVFAPVEYRGHFLVDGAILDNLPSGIVRQDLHADIVIGVQLDASNFTDSDVSSIVGIFARAYSAGTARNEKISQRSIDVLIHVESGTFSTGDYGKTAPLVALGYAAAEKQRHALQPLALNATDWQAYLTNRASRAQPQPQPLRVATVEGGSPGAQQNARLALQPLLNKPLKPEPILTSLRDVQENGTYQAGIETFSTSQPATSSPTNRVETAAPVDGIKVRLSPVRNGPPFLLFGADLTLENSNVSRSTYDFRLLNTNLGGFGSELRSDVRVGFLTQLSSEYYRLLTPSGFFAEPRVGIVRQPVYLWQNQVRISEHLQQQAGGGLESGRTFTRNLQVSATYDVEVVRWHPVSGEDGTLPVSGTAQTALAHVVYDSRHPGEASDTGIRFDLKAGSLFHAVDSQTAPLVEALISKRFALAPNTFFTVSAEANTYFRRNVTEPLRFAVGGPLRLSASSVDEYRGTDALLTRATVSRRIAPLPLGYGQGLYAGVAYEAAELWSPEQRAILRQDGVVTLVGVTPLGNVTFGGSAGDAAHRKIFFTFGRLF